MAGVIFLSSWCAVTLFSEAALCLILVKITTFAQRPRDLEPPSPCPCPVCMASLSPSPGSSASRYLLGRPLSPQPRWSPRADHLPLLPALCCSQLPSGSPLSSQAGGPLLSSHLIVPPPASTAFRYGQDGATGLTKAYGPELPTLAYCSISTPPTSPSSASPSRSSFVIGLGCH